MIPFQDLADLSEDSRIDQIGRKTMSEKLTVGFIVDSDPGKAERYIDKLKAKFPGIRVIFQGPGPVPETILVKVAPPS